MIFILSHTEQNQIKSKWNKEEATSLGSRDKRVPMSSKAAWCTLWVSNHPGLYSKTVSSKQANKHQTKSPEWSKIRSQIWQMPLVPALGRLRGEDEVYVFMIGKQALYWLRYLPSPRILFFFLKSHKIIWMCFALIHVDCRVWRQW